LLLIQLSDRGRRKLQIQRFAISATDGSQDEPGEA
jgi:hypothetical protein